MAERVELAEGRAVLHLGDCLEVLRSLPAGSVDAVITDPPYNVGFSYAGGDGDRKADYSEWCLLWLTELRRVCSGAVAVSVGQSNLSLWASIAPPDWWLAWWKPAAMGRCVVGFNNWEPIALYGKPCQSGCDVIRASIKPDTRLSGHPCPKPLEWATKQLEMLCPEEGALLDPFMGSGTTGVACMRTGRRFIGCEIDPGYFEVARRRIDNVTSDGPLFAQQAMMEVK